MSRWFGNTDISFPKTLAAIGGNYLGVKVVGYLNGEGGFTNSGWPHDYDTGFFHAIV